MPYLRFPRCFLSGSFDQSDRVVFDWFRKLLDAVDFEVVTGEDPLPHPPAETIRTRIQSCTVLVAVLTRRDKIEGTDEWRCPTFVGDEVAIAFSFGRPVALFAEEGVKVEGVGPQSTTYVIWNRDDLGGSAPVVVRYLVNLRNEVSPALEVQGDVATARALQVELSNRVAELEAVTEKFELNTWNLAFFLGRLSGRLLTLPQSLISAVQDAYNSLNQVNAILEEIEKARESMRPKLSLPTWRINEPPPELPKDHPLRARLVTERDSALVKHKWGILRLTQYSWPSECRAMGLEDALRSSMTAEEFKNSFGHDLTEMDSPG